MSSDEKVRKALDRLSEVRDEADNAREKLGAHEDKIEEALLMVDVHQRDVEREACRLAHLEDEIGDIRLALFRRGIMDTHQ